MLFEIFSIHVNLTDSHPFISEHTASSQSPRSSNGSVSVDVHITCESPSDIVQVIVEFGV